MTSRSAAIGGPDVLALGLRRFSARQEAVLDVVEQVLLREGIRGVRMGRLADEAACSRSTLYELATSKEDLLLLVLDRMMRRIMQHGTDAIEAASGPVEQLRAMMTSGALDFGVLGPGFMEAVREHPPARLLFDRRVVEGLGTLRDLIDRAVAEGSFRPVNSEVVAEGIFAVISRFTDPDVVRSTRIGSSDSLAELVGVMVDGLRPR